MKNKASRSAGNERIAIREGASTTATQFFAASVEFKNRLHGHPTIDGQYLPRNIASIRPCKIGDGSCDIIGLPKAC